MRETLCWYCNKPGTGRCSWDESLTPVPDWIARPSKTDGFDTFRVDACPLFDLDIRSMGSLLKLIHKEVET